MQLLWAFVLKLNGAVTNKKGSSVPESSASLRVKSVLDVLDELGRWVDEIPCVSSTQGRFGNRAFRTWHERLVREAPDLMKKIVCTREPSNGSSTYAFSETAICEELSTYLCSCFGDAERIDYGSGHEAMFAVVLYCLRRTDVISESDDASLVLLVFRKYLSVTRKLQTKYNLEPAGSHGVWGLDDYSFLPFLWGSAQLLNSQRISPNFIDNDALIQENRAEYLYVDAVGFIRDVKKGPFFEHSPMLYDISRVPGGWKKINQGMIQMYRGEVWGKRVVVQHMLFGQIFQFESGGSSAPSNDTSPNVVAAS